MNKARFNDWFEKPITDMEGADVWRKASVSPLFDYTAVRSHVMDLFKQRAEDGQQNDGSKLFPFPIFRMNLRLFNSVKDKNPVMGYNCVVFDSGKIFVRVVEAEIRPELQAVGVNINDVKRRIWCLELCEEGGTYRFHGYGKAKTWRMDCADKLILRWEDETPESIKRAGGTQEVYKQLITAIAGFSLDLKNPNIHVAEVRPDGLGRSVTWVKARTHFVLLTKGHPANKKGLAHGSTIASDHAGELTRMAHERQAHDRTYRHTRYTYARGQTRRVAACWVGPKEWREEGGKQIYKVLHPVDDMEKWA